MNTDAQIFQGFLLHEPNNRFVTSLQARLTPGRAVTRSNVQSISLALNSSHKTTWNAWRSSENCREVSSLGVLEPHEAAPTHEVGLCGLEKTIFQSRTACHQPFHSPCFSWNNLPAMKPGSAWMQWSCPGSENEYMFDVPNCIGSWRNKACMSWYVGGWNPAPL